MPHSTIRIVAFFALAATFLGRTDVGERGFKTSEPGVMAEVEAALTKEGIRFRRDSDGFLRYDAEDEDIVRRIRGEVERKLSGGVAVKYDDEESREFMKRLLASQGMEFRIESRNDGEWIRWYPENEVQKNEIEMKVVEHHFDAQREETTSECESQELPSNNSLNEDAARPRRAC